MGEVLREFLELLGGGITALGESIGSGVNEFVTDLFLTTTVNEGVTTVTGLSAFGGVTAIFGGIALAVGLTTLVFNWIKSIGN